MNSYWKIVIGIALLCSTLASTFAHPLDISSTLLTLHGDRASAVTYFHPYEAEWLLKNKNLPFSEIGDFLEYPNVFTEYLTGNILFQASGIDCKIIDPTVVMKDAYLVMTEGVELEYSIVCPWQMTNLAITNTFFTNFVLQTNRVTLIGSGWGELLYKVATPKIPKIIYTEGMSIEKTDTDMDGLSDEEEIAYSTDPKLGDTDGDFYLDSEEVIYGWDPKNPAVSPGQPQRNSLPKKMGRPGSSIHQQENVPYSPWVTTETTEAKWLAVGVSGGEYFTWLLKKISDFSKNPSDQWISLSILFFSTIVLWFLHAMGPGHAKSILTFLMVDKNTSRKSGILFAIVFSITHIIDIVFLYVLMEVYSLFQDPAIILSFIQKYSPLVLMILWLYLLYTAWRWKFQEEKIYTWKHIWLFGIISWLAPCTFGWSLFFFLFSLGKISWIPILIWGVWLGIFLFLLILIFFLDSIKKYTYKRLRGASQISGILSAIFIIILGWTLFFLQ
jgi:ABC-type nickel/cobalt efflux system permease component RcnA